MMTEKCRYCYVLDNNKPTFYDLNKKDILQMYQVEDLLNSLSKENKQLKKENKELRQYLSWQQMELEELEDINKNVIE